MSNLHTELCTFDLVYGARQKKSRVQTASSKKGFLKLLKRNEIPICNPSECPQKHNFNIWDPTGVQLRLVKNQHPCLTTMQHIQNTTKKVLKGSHTATRKNRKRRKL